jgi:hypothetical protein
MKKTQARKRVREDLLLSMKFSKKKAGKAYRHVCNSDTGLQVANNVQSDAPLPLSPRKCRKKLSTGLGSVKAERGEQFCPSCRVGRHTWKENHETGERRWA